MGDKKKISVVSVVALLLVAVVVTGALPCAKKVGEKHSKGDDSGQVSDPLNVITELCQPTDYRETCVNSLKSAAGNTTDPKELIRVGFQVTVDALKEAMKNSTALRYLAKDSRTIQALENCRELMDSAIDDMESSFDQMGTFDMSRVDDYVHELRILLSGAITFEESCLDEFENMTTTNNNSSEAAREKMKMILEASRELTSNGLAMVTGISKVLNSTNNISRRLLGFSGGDNNNNGFPSWVSAGRRKLLNSTIMLLKPDAIVAKNGSCCGYFKNITDALNTVPKNNNKTFVIYIKEGVYQENVMVTKKMTNVMFIGDGPTKTKITGDKNYVDGIQTMKTATVSALGANFMAKDIGFENTAGPIKQQAVALRVQSDKSVFYNCRMDGYQDTLYAHAHAQFYRDCTITGTVDFIFGDAAAVFQNCKVIVRKPLDKQKCTVTASGRKNQLSATGIVLQNCSITAAGDYLKDVNKAYLGRPWKKYARTIIMQSEIDDLIQPEGWLPWLDNYALETCWFGEYGNRGPGANQTGRVTWKGIRNPDDQQVKSFTVENFIRDYWIKPTGVPFAPGMMIVNK